MGSCISDSIILDLRCRVLEQELQLSLKLQSQSLLHSLQVSAYMPDTPTTFVYENLGSFLGRNLTPTLLLSMPCAYQSAVLSGCPVCI